VHGVSWSRVNSPPGKMGGKEKLPHRSLIFAWQPPALIRKGEALAIGI
jgi:hypothetical protein